jgi:conflict system STAND superfamily ATPase
VAATPFDELPVEMTAEWQLVDLTAGVRDYIRTVPLPPDPGAPGVVKTAQVNLANDGLNRLRIGLTAAGLDPKYFAWPPAHDPDRPPYRGLRPLEAEDAGIFFGRDGSIVEAFDRLRGLRDHAPPRLLVILGASGAGKSSFLRAGLLPRVARDDRHFVTLPVIRPERAAISGETGLISSLTHAVAARGLRHARADIRAAVLGGIGSLRPLLTEVVARATPAVLGSSTAVPPKGPTLVLPIDQGEELFLAEGRDEASNLLDLVRGLVTEDDPAVIAVFTIRSDNYERLQLAPELEGAHQGTLSLPPM